MKQFWTLILLGLLSLSAQEQPENSTMTLMDQGMTKMQQGFVLNNKAEILDGLMLLEETTEMYAKEDLSHFIPLHNKIQVAKNINKNLSENIQKLKASLKTKSHSDATKYYGQILNNCVACHAIVRGW